MNSSTGMPFNTWMFLKAASDICGAEAAAGRDCAKATPKEARRERLAPPVAISHAAAPLMINHLDAFMEDSS